MRTTIIKACVAVLLLTNLVRAVELDKIERAIARLPTFTAKQQAYCLLVFGPEAQKRVWIVQDGPVLYVDRNGNGDLTEPGERIEADPKSSDVEDEVFQFSAGDIPDGDFVHKNLEVGRAKLDHMRDMDEEIRAALDKNSRFRACSVRIDVAMQNLQGEGLGGRVPQWAWSRDANGLLQFADGPADAPIIHFGGPLTVTLSSMAETWRIGRSKDLDLVVGTPGVGPGSTAAIAYNKAIPDKLIPRAEITFPPLSADGEPIKRVYDLTRRCCTVNLYGDVAVPEDVGAGAAKVEISLESWPGVPIAPSSHEFKILPPKPGPKLYPVSARLVGKLAHDNPQAGISGIRFSPDGKRVLAGDYPGGIVNVWDVHSGKKLLSIDAGKGYRSTGEFFIPTDDWSKLFAWHETRGVFGKVEREGRVLSTVEYSSMVRSWSLDSGSLLRTFQSDPPHGIRFMALAPNGKYFVTLDETPGEFELHRPRDLCLWDEKTDTYREVAKGNAVPGCISSDSRLVAVTLPLEDDKDSSMNSAIEIFTAPQWNSVVKIPMQGKLCDARAHTFASNNKVLVGTVRVLEKQNDWENSRGYLKLWDATSGEELLSIPAPNKGDTFAFEAVSPDGQTLLITTWNRGHVGRGSLVHVDIASKTWKMIEVPTEGLPHKPVFHPSGRYFATSTQVIPKEQIRDAKAEELEQPRIVLLSVPEGKPLETLVAPQCFFSSMAFSPDGSKLASSGPGAVLLWDFRDQPGTSGP
jgi:WD40 repeat protein